MDQFTIEIPEGVFYIAEACAGLRFLIASIAFGVLYACLIYRSPWRRAAFIAGLLHHSGDRQRLPRAGHRAWLGHIVGSAQAAAADHVIYGWVFFSVVILLLILAGLPFREDMTRPAGSLRGRSGCRRPPWSPLWRAGLLVAAVMAAGPGVAAALDRRTAAVPMVALPGFVPGPGCGPAEVATSTWSGQSRGLLSATQRFTCDGLGLTATITVFPPRANPAQPIAARRAATESERSGRRRHQPTRSGRRWQLVETQQPDHVAASALWIDGDPSSRRPGRAAAPGPQQPVRRHRRPGAGGGEPRRRRHPNDSPRAPAGERGDPCLAGGPGRARRAHRRTGAGGGITITARWQASASI